MQLVLKAGKETKHSSSLLLRLYVHLYVDMSRREDAATLSSSRRNRVSEVANGTARRIRVSDSDVEEMSRNSGKKQVCPPLSPKMDEANQVIDFRGRNNVRNILKRLSSLPPAMAQAEMEARKAESARSGTPLSPSRKRLKVPELVASYSLDNNEDVSKNSVGEESPGGDTTSLRKVPHRDVARGTSFSKQNGSVKHPTSPREATDASGTANPPNCKGKNVRRLMDSKLHARLRGYLSTVQPRKYGALLKLTHQDRKVARKRHMQKQIKLSQIESTNMWLKKHAQFRRAKCQSKEEEKKYASIFQDLDRDGNGVLEPADLQTAMKEIGIELGRQEVLARMASIDINNNGKVSFDEFLHGYKKSNEWEVLHDIRRKRERKKQICKGRSKKAMSTGATNGVIETPRRPRLQHPRGSISRRASAISNEGTTPRPLLQRALASEAEKDLPFYLWVPAYNRQKVLERLMQADKLDIPEDELVPKIHDYNSPKRQMIRKNVEHLEKVRKETKYGVKFTRGVEDVSYSTSEFRELVNLERRNEAAHMLLADEDRERENEQLTMTSSPSPKPGREKGGTKASHHPTHGDSNKQYTTADDNRKEEIHSTSTRKGVCISGGRGAEARDNKSEDGTGPSSPVLLSSRRRKFSIFGESQRPGTADLDRFQNNATRNDAVCVESSSVPDSSRKLPEATSSTPGRETRSSNRLSSKSSRSSGMSITLSSARMNTDSVEAEENPSSVKRGSTRTEKRRKARQTCLKATNFNNGLSLMEMWQKTQSTVHDIVVKANPEIEL